MDPALLELLFSDEMPPKGQPQAKNMPAPTTVGDINPLLEGILAAQGDSPPMTVGDVSEESVATRGPGAGKDDMIPAVIEDENGNPVQEARLSPGEFVLPANLVSFIGDGDTDSGASLLNTLKENPDAAEEVKNILRRYAG